MNFILLQINHATARTGEPSAFSIFNGKQLNQNNSLPHKCKFVKFSILRMSLFANRARCLVKFKSETGSRPIVSKPIPFKELFKIKERTSSSIHGYSSKYRAELCR